MVASSGLTAQRAPERLHLAHVEGLRAVAALTVYVNHAYAQSWSVGLNEFPSGVLSLFSYSLVAGHLAVSVFIVISGFCLALPVVAAGDRLRDGALEFFKRRARRILPPYYGALALSLALIATVIGDKTGSLWDVPILVTWQSIVSHVLLLQDLFATGSINYVFWSIAVEWQLYFVFPLLVWGIRRHGAPTVAALALGVGYALRFGFADTRLARANPHYLGLFALGMLGAYLVQSKALQYRKYGGLDAWKWLALAALAAVVGMCWFWGFRESEKRFAYFDFPVAILALSVLVHSSRSLNGLLRRGLSLRPLVFVGTFSYSLYLVHAPLLQLLWKFALRPLGISNALVFLALMTIGFALVLASSYGFFRVFEAPFLRKTGRLAPVASVADLAANVAAAPVGAQEPRA